MQLHSRMAVATCLALATMLPIPSGARAGTATGNITVAAIVGGGAGSCTVNGSPLNFGSIPVTTTAGASFIEQDVSVPGIIAVTCTAGTSFAITLGAGTGPQATVANRRMTSGGGAVLNYAIFKDPTLTGGIPVAYGDGTLGTQVINSTGSGSTMSFPLIGRIFGGQQATNGTYSDSVAVTLNF